MDQLKENIDKIYELISSTYKLQDVNTEFHKSMSGPGAIYVLTYKKKCSFYTQMCYIYPGSQGNRFGSKIFTKEFIFRQADDLTKKTIISVNEEYGIHDAIKIFLE